MPVPFISKTENENYIYFPIILSPWPWSYNQLGETLLPKECLNFGFPGNKTWIMKLGEKFTWQGMIPGNSLWSSCGAENRIWAFMHVRQGLYQHSQSLSSKHRESTHKYLTLDSSTLPRTLETAQVNLIFLSYTWI